MLIITKILKPSFPIIFISDKKIILHQSTNADAILDPRIIRFQNTTLVPDEFVKTEIVIEHNQYFERIKG